MLIDEGSETIKAYGILNEGQGQVPHPTVVVVDREGVAQYFHLDEDYSKRPPPSQILDTLKSLQ